MDRPGVAVVSESFVKRHWPNKEPLRRTFVHRDIERTIIGVVGDIQGAWARADKRTADPIFPPAQVAVRDLSSFDGARDRNPPAMTWRSSGAVRRIVGSGG